MYVYFVDSELENISNEKRNDYVCDYRIEKYIYKITDTPNIILFPASQENENHCIVSQKN